MKGTSASACKITPHSRLPSLGRLPVVTELSRLIHNGKVPNFVVCLSDLSSVGHVLQVQWRHVLCMSLSPYLCLKLVRFLPSFVVGLVVHVLPART